MYPAVSTRTRSGQPIGEGWVFCWDRARVAPASSFSPRLGLAGSSQWLPTTSHRVGLERPATSALRRSGEGSASTASVQFPGNRRDIARKGVCGFLAMPDS